MKLIQSNRLNTIKTLSLAQPWLLLIAAVIAISIWGDIAQTNLWLVISAYSIHLILFSLQKAKQAPPLINKHSIYNQLKNAIPFFIDLGFYAYLLSMHGGASSGATFVLFIPVISAALQLARRTAWFITLSSIAIYSFLMWQGVAEHFHHLGNNFIEHLVGMWLTFIMSSLLMTWFITQQKVAIKNQAKTITKLKERQFKDEQILAVATTAANAAHSLGTPLSTANLLIEEIQQSPNQEAIRELAEQIEICSKAVHKITATARNAQPENQTWQSVIDFIKQTTEFWWISFNNVQYQLDISKLPKDKSLLVLTDFNLQMALSNILQNAASASLQNNSDQIEIKLELTEQYIQIQILDNGKGIAPDLLQQLGQKVIPKSNQGMGIGLVLANTSIENLGGRLTLTNRDFNTGLGTNSLIELPYRILDIE